MQKRILRKTIFLQIGQRSGFTFTLRTAVAYMVYRR
jgi:hypothetical protein